MKETVISSNKPGVKTATGKATDQPISIVEQTGYYQEPLTVAVYGLQGTGKSRLGATGPGDIAAIPLDRKAKQTIINTAREQGKRVFMPNIDLVRANNPLLASTMLSYCMKKGDGEVNGQAMMTKTKEMNIFGPQPTCCAIHHFRWHVQRVKHSLIEICAMESVRTVIIDSFTNLWDDILFANHGRTDRINPMDRSADNREVQEILGITTGKNVVLTLKSKEVWKNNKPTGEVEWAGYSHLGYEVGVIMHMTRDEKTGTFAADIQMCQASAALIGDGGHHDQTLLVDGEINMFNLASLVYPDGDFSDWSS